MSPRETEWKCEHSSDKGVVLECAVHVGKVKEVPRDEEDTSWAFGSMVKQGVDAVLLRRGKVKWGKHKGKDAGDEVVIYSWDQARVLREVPRDPVP